jgi:hypothetical protein
MASINLAGAIGLGGKRESIISGLPDAINKAGDALNKTIGDELRRQEAERAAKKEKEQAIKDMFAKQVQTTIGDYDVHEKDKPRLEADGVKAIAEQYMLFTDPNISYAEKQKEQFRILSELKQKSERYHKDFEATQYLAKFASPENEGIVDDSRAKQWLAGNYGTQQETVKESDIPSILRQGTNNPPEEKQWSKTIEKPKFPDQQNKEYFDLPIEDRMKVSPSGLVEEIDKRVIVRKGDPVKAIEQFTGDLGTYVKKKNIDGVDKFVIDEIGLENERKAFELSIQTGEGLGKETSLRRQNLINNYYKQAIDLNYPKEKAIEIATNYATEVMLNDFEKTKKEAIRKRMMNQDLTAAKGGGQAPTSLTSNDKWAIADPIPVDKMENTLSGQQIEDIEKEVLDKFPDPKEKAYNQTPEQYQAYLKELKSNREKIVEKRKAEETKKMFGGKDVAYVSVQSVGTSQNPTQPFAIGKGIADGVYIDQKTNEILGFGVSTIESDGSKGEFSFERATPEKVIDYKTNLGVVKGTGKNLWESKYPKKSVSSQKVSEKKVEAPKKVETPKYKTMDNINQSQFNAMKDNEIVIVNGVLRIKKDGKLKKYQPKQ